jgi:hypothetical protein
MEVWAAVQDPLSHHPTPEVASGDVTAGHTKWFVRGFAMSRVSAMRQDAAEDRA